jgi:hypothetical protein
MAKTIQNFNGTLTLQTAGNGGTTPKTIYTVPSGRIAKIVGNIMTFNTANDQYQFHVCGGCVGGASTTPNQAFSENGRIELYLNSGDDLVLSGMTSGGSAQVDGYYTISVIEEDA